MKLSFKELRGSIRSALSEAMGATTMLDVVQLHLVLSKEKKVEEILTGIRIIKGVATVNQLKPVQRNANGSRVLDIKVTFDPQDMETLVYVDAMARIAKDIPDVTMVIVKAVNDQPVRDASGKRALVY